MQSARAHGQDAYHPVGNSDTLRVKQTIRGCMWTLQVHAYRDFSVLFSVMFRLCCSDAHRETRIFISPIINVGDVYFSTAQTAATFKIQEE